MVLFLIWGFFGGFFWWAFLVDFVLFNFVLRLVFFF